VGSLFPLSKPGSITLAYVLYSGLFAGDDPRVALHATRQALRTGDTSTHDWASLVAYASLPETIDAQVMRARYEASKRSIGILNSQIEDLAIAGIPDQQIEDPASGKLSRPLVRLMKDLDEAGRRMPNDGGYEIEGNGMLGSKEKRRAQACSRWRTRPRVTSAKPGLPRVSKRSLKQQSTIATDACLCATVSIGTRVRHIGC